MVRKFPVTPIAAAVPANLPVYVLLALPQASSRQPQNSFFNLPGAINTLVGDWHLALKVMKPRIWAPGWDSSQFRDFLYEAWPTPSSLPATGVEELRAESFLGLTGPDKPTVVDHSNYGVVHCVSDIALNWNRDPLLQIGNSRLSVGALRDELVRSGVKLLILQTFEKETGLIEEQRLAEFIVGAGGPAVLIVAGRDQKANKYLFELYSGILCNQSIEELAQRRENGPQVWLLCGEGGDRLLQFEASMEILEKRLGDYSSLVNGLLDGIYSLQANQPRALVQSVSEIDELKDFDFRINSELRSLKKVKAKPWDGEHRGAIFLAEIAERVASITKDIGWHTGEGPCHTKYDMLDYQLRQFQRERPSPTATTPLRRETQTEYPGGGGLEASISGGPFTEVVVFFGTNRPNAAEGVHYGTGRDSMHYGRCLVSVPTDRRIGKIPRPSIWKWYREDRKKHFVIVDVSERNRDGFLGDLKTYLDACGSTEALVFVHGFNVTFADAVFRTAQISADLNFAGAPILFSWPSKGAMSPLGYTHDETQARWTLPDLRAFLEMIAGESGATTIHLLAHSMGNRVLTEALCQIGVAAAKRSPAIFNELILTAPDIDAGTFTRDIAPVLVPAAKRVTLYASSNDKALKFSKNIHGYNRAGESGDNVVLLKRVDTVDVSLVDTIPITVTTGRCSPICSI